MTPGPLLKTFWKPSLVELDRGRITAPDAPNQWVFLDPLSPAGAVVNAAKGHGSRLWPPASGF